MALFELEFLNSVKYDWVTPRTAEAGGLSHNSKFSRQQTG
jgi:hypothetical protein